VGPLPALWGGLLDEMWGYVRGAGVQAGRDVMVYLVDVPNVEVGVDLEGELVAPWGRIVACALPRGRAATTVAPGALSREGVAAAHAAVVEWCNTNGHARAGVRWEVYDHWRDDDPDLFETAVFRLLDS